MDKKTVNKFILFCLQVNPDADLNADPEVDLSKIGRPPPNGPTAPFNGDGYDEEESIGWSSKVMNCMQSSAEVCRP